MKHAGRLVVPPLRESLEDLPLLAHTLLRAAGLAALTRESAALRLLMSLSWPGNLRA